MRYFTSLDGHLAVNHVSYIAAAAQELHQAAQNCLYITSPDGTHTAIILLALDGQAVGSASLRSDLPYFSCSTFPANESEADLLPRFGAKNVTATLVEGGGAGGEMNRG